MNDYEKKFKIKQKKIKISNFNDQSKIKKFKKKSEINHKSCLKQTAK